MRSNWISIWVSAFVFVMAMALLWSVSACDTLRTETPLLIPVRGLEHENIVHGYYVVALKEGTTVDVLERTKANVEALGGKVTLTYENAFRGFAAYMEPTVVEAVQRDSQVEYIEVVHLMQATGVQSCAPWNLSYLSQWEGNFKADEAAYVYGGTGKGVRVYVIDRGVQASHIEFKDEMGVSRVSDGLFKVGNAWTTTLWDIDPNGHGTAATSIAVGHKTGVAKEGMVFSIRVDDDANCAAPNSADIALALDQIAAEQIKPNASLSVVLLEHAVSGEIAQICNAMKNINNVVFVVPAGNDGLEITNDPNNQTSTPAYCGVSSLDSTSAMLVVGAHGKPPNDNTMWSKSNYGPIVDLFAPGEGVIVASPDGGVCTTSDINGNMGSKITPVGTSMDHKYAMIDGTSAAAAHVAGLAAILIEQNSSMGALQIKSKLLQSVTGKRNIQWGSGPDDSRPIVQTPAYGFMYSGHKSNVPDVDGCNDTVTADAGARICAFNPEDIDLFASQSPSCFDNNVCTKELCDEGIACIDGRCEPCGESDEACCANSTCLEGNICSEGTCKPCGKDSNLCCASNTCDSGLICSEGNCKPCGKDSNLCCASNTCDSGLICSEGNCQLCGADNQLCCASDSCNSGLWCYDGTCGCGGELQKCCTTGDACDTGTGNTTLKCNASEICVPCGLPGNPCCTAPNGMGGTTDICFSGLECDPSTKTCGDCGAKNQICCDGTTCPEVGATCNAVGQCVKCGAQANEPCCNEEPNPCGYGATPLTCISGICSACGAKDIPCCKEQAMPCGSGNDSLTCVSGTCKACGGLNEACCADGPTPCELVSPALTCYANTCQECGGAGQDCCGMDDCNSGLTCHAGQCRIAKDVDLWVDFFPLDYVGDDADFSGNSWGPYVQVSLKVESYLGGIRIRSLNNAVNDPDCACFYSNPDPMTNGCPEDPNKLASGPYFRKCGSLVTMMEIEDGKTPPTRVPNHTFAMFKDMPFFAIPNAGLVGDADSPGIYTFKAEYQDKTQDDWDDVYALSVANPSKATILNPSTAVLSLNCVGDTANGDVCSDYAPPSTECSACIAWLRVKIFE